MGCRLAGRARAEQFRRHPLRILPRSRYRLRGIYEQELSIPRGTGLTGLGTRYDFAAVREGRIKRDVIPDHTASAAQGWYFNTRREKFKDKRVREAFINAFDFEWVNATIMYKGLPKNPLRFEIPT